MVWIGTAVTIVGLDLGASAMRTGVWSSGEPRLLVDTDGSPDIPSVVAWEEEELVVGARALRVATSEPEYSVRCVPTLLGHSATDIALEALASRHWCEFGATPEGELSVTLNGETFTPENLAALLVQHALTVADLQLPTPVRSGFVAYPVPETPVGRDALALAVAAGGLQNATLIPSPVAAAAALCPPGPVRPVVIVDVGAAHLCVALLEVAEGLQPSLLSAVGCDLGGDDIDQALVQSVIDSGPRNSLVEPAIAERLRQLCERAKRRLATERHVTERLPFDVQDALGIFDDLSWSRRMLQDVSQPLLLQLDESCAEARRALGKSKSVELYVTGGMGRFDFVRHRVEAALGTKIQPSQVEHAVALGAARLAHLADVERIAGLGQARISWRPSASASAAHVLETAELRKLRQGHGQALTPEPPSVPSAQQAPEVVSTDTRAMDRRSSFAHAESAQPPAESSVPTRAQASQPLEAESARVAAARPSAVRAGRGPSGVTPLEAGTVRNPKTPAELLRLPLAGTITSADLEPISIPLLLLLLSSKRKSGELTLRMNGRKALAVAFINGRPSLTDQEEAALADTCCAADGVYAFTPLHEDPTPRQTPRRVLGIVTDAIRRMVMMYPAQDLSDALGERLNKAPALPATRFSALTRFQLSPMETRIAKFSLTGDVSARDLLTHAGSSRSAILTVLVLLNACDLLQWEVPRRGEQLQSAAQQLDARAERLEAAHHFDVLGVHWSADPEEITAAYRRLREEYSPGQTTSKLAPEASSRILLRVERAYDVLRDAEQRGEYRQATFPDVDFDAIEEFLRAAHHAGQAPGGSAAEAAERTLREISRDKRTPKS